LTLARLGLTTEPGIVDVYVTQQPNLGGDGALYVGERELRAAIAVALGKTAHKPQFVFRAGEEFREEPVTVVISIGLNRFAVLGRSSGLCWSIVPTKH
jgi:hypothetical protein